MSCSCHAICCNPTSTTYDSAISNDNPSLNHPDHLRDRGRPRLFWIDNSIITLKLPLERDEILRSPQISQRLSRWPIRTARRGLRDPCPSTVKTRPLTQQLKFKSRPRVICQDGSCPCHRGRQGGASGRPVEPEASSSLSLDYQKTTVKQPS